MMRFFRHRLSRYRALWLAVLVLCTVLQPTLVVASEIHEAQHRSPDATHTTTSSTHSSVDQPSWPNDRGDAVHTNDPWHALLHQGHCCFQGATIVGPIELTVTTVPAKALVPSLARQSRPIARERLLRPPIRG